MLPSRDLDLAFPRPVEEESGDEQAGARTLAVAAQQPRRRSCGHSLRALRSTRGIDVEVTLKALPFTPPVKIYLLNDTEALFAYYTVTRRPEQIDGNTVELFDVLGSDSTLFTFKRRRRGAGRGLRRGVVEVVRRLVGHHRHRDHPRELIGQRCRSCRARGTPPLSMAAPPQQSSRPSPLRAR